MLVILVARAENRVIGLDGGLPWHIPDDLRRVKRITMGKPLIMGRLTYESVVAASPAGRTPLPGRAIIAVSRRTFPVADGVDLVHDFDAALRAARARAREMGACEVVAFGGARIYRDALATAGRIYETRVHCEPDGDAFFPELPDGEWCVEGVPERHGPARSGGPEYSYITHVRRAGRRGPNSSRVS